MLRTLALTVSICLFATATLADDPRITTALRRRLLDQNAIQRDVEFFCQSRVPLTPIPQDIPAWEQVMETARQQTFDKVIFRGKAAEWRSLPTRPEWLSEIDAGDYRIRKLRYEVVPGLWVCGLLYEPKTLSGKVPVILNVNGHDREGKAADYKQIRCINQVRRGMLALNLEWFNMGQLRQKEFDHYRLNQLDLCGTSGVSCFYLAMSRALDVLLMHEHADPARVAVTGLSGGGWQTIFISSLDPRVTLCDPVAGYSSFRTRAVVRADLGDSEQTPTDLATTADYALLTAMRAPRPTLLTFNDRDHCCFQAGNAIPELLAAARPAFELYGAGDRLSIHVNHAPGTHNYDRDNREAFYRMLGRHFFAGVPFDPEEIPCESDVRPASELEVDLPAENATFTSLAKTLAQGINHSQTRADDSLREQLRETLRYKPLALTAEHVATVTEGEVDIHHWKLRIADAWTIPAVEFVPEGAQTSRLMLADAGRASLGPAIEAALASKTRVLAIDPLHIGESQMPTRDFLFGLLIAAVGERPLGVQAGQIAAVAGWWSTACGRPVEIHSAGPRTSLMAWCASAMNRQPVSKVVTKEAFTSLKEIIDRGLAVPDGPEMFCFGLLELLDVPQLVELAK